MLTIATLCGCSWARVGQLLYEREDGAWDKQIQLDLAAGKLDGLLGEMDDDIAQGKLRDLR